MSHEDIIGAVDKSIEELCRVFRNSPTLFYTEQDIISFYYNLLQYTLPNPRAHDRDGAEHLLVHLDYLTPQGGGDSRGHFDLAVLNPDFIAQHPYEALKAQDYGLFEKTVLPRLDEHNPAVLYGLEFLLRRDPFPLLKDGGTREAVDAFIAQVNQEVDELVAAKKIPGFMDRIKMLTFIKGGADDVRTFLFKTLTERVEVVLCFSL